MSIVVETESTTLPPPTAAAPPMPTPGTTTAKKTAEAAEIAPHVSVARRGWLRRLEYVPARISRRCKIGSSAGAATGSPSSYSYRRLASMLSWSSKTGGAVDTAAASAASGGARPPPPPSSYRRLASSLSRSLSSIRLRAGSASAALDEVTFRVMYVVEAVVLGLALSCFFLCCGCQL